MPTTRVYVHPSRARRRRSVIAGAVVAVVVAIAGCGSDDEFTNADRAPVQVTLSASITPRNVTVSPARIGAGPVELLASNQTSISQELTLRSASPSTTERVLEQRTGPINPGDTASLTADLAQGTYRVTAGSHERAPATIRVGPSERAADRLLQP